MGKLSKYPRLLLFFWKILQFRKYTDVILIQANIKLPAPVNHSIMKWNLMNIHYFIDSVDNEMSKNITIS